MKKANNNVSSAAEILGLRGIRLDINWKNYFHKYFRNKSHPY
jgi:hypothetical protein